MRKTTAIIGVLCALLAAFIMYAQKPVQGKPKVTFKGTTYADNGAIAAGKISVKDFERVLKSKLVSKDSAGRLNPVISFNFSYAERGVFEDSTGKMRIMTEYYAIQSELGELPDFFLNSIKGLAKHGDTIIYNEILTFFPDSAKTRYYSKPLRLILTD